MGNTNMMLSATLYVVARLEARPDKIEQLKTVLVELVSATRTEKGCLRYELLHNQASLTDFTFVEEWASEADLEAHLKSEHIQTALN